MDRLNAGEARAGLYVVMTAVTDADLRLYVEDCLSRIPEVRLTDNSGPSRPHLIVTDRPGPGLEPGLGDIPRLHVVDEPPSAANTSSTNVDFILTPFDAQSLARAVRRALYGAG